MKRLFSIMLAVIMLTAYSPEIFSQGPPPPPRKAQERLDLIKKMKILELLDLDEANGEKFLLKYNAAESKIKDIDMQIHDLSDDLKKAIDKEDKAKYTELSNKLIAKQKEFFDAQIDKLNSVKSVLNEEQYAKYVLFENNFPKMIRKFLMDKRERD